MKKTIKNMRGFFKVFIALLLCFTLLSESVLADSTGNVTCDSDGNVTKSQFFSPSLVFPAYENTKNCGPLEAKKFFSGIACNFVVTLNSVFSKLYCSIQFGMKEILTAVLTLFVVVYGAKMLIGMQEATLSSAILAAVKIGIVITFSTQGLIGVGIIYDFFVNLMFDTVRWTSATINDCNSFDLEAMQTCVTNATMGSFSNVFDAIDSKIYNALMGVAAVPADGSNPGSPAIPGLFSENAEFISFFIILSYLCAPIFYIAASLIFTAIKIFISTFVSLLLCIVVVAFLISLSPIFLCFMLFGSTYNVFDNWLKFLISYTLQPMIVIAIFSMWVLIASDFTGFIGQIGNVVRTEYSNKDRGTVNTGDSGLLFCQMHHTNKPTTFGLSPGPIIVPVLNVGGPSIACCNLEFDMTEPDAPGFCVDDVTDTIKIEDIDSLDLVPPEYIIKDGKFIKFLAYHIISMLVICYTFFNLLKMAPQIAQDLTRSQSQIPLGAGFGSGNRGLFALVSKASSKIRESAKAGTNLAGRGVQTVAGIGAVGAAAPAATGTLAGEQLGAGAGVGTRK